MSRFAILALFLVALVPAAALAQPGVSKGLPDSYVQAATQSESPLEVGQSITVFARTPVTASACGVDYQLGYWAFIHQDLGTGRRGLLVWGDQLQGQYRVEELIAGDQGMDCLVLRKLLPM